MTPAEIRIRTIIRDHCQKRMNAITYRITKSGQVDYFGKMPNTNRVGWYFVAHIAADWAKTIEAENALIRKGHARG